MTAIVGVAEAGRVYLGADSGAMDSTYDFELRVSPKVFSLPPFVIGYTSSFRMGQLLQYSLVMPPRDGVDVERFMATTFIDAVRTCLKAGGWARTNTEQQEQAGQFLVGYEGRLFTISSDYQVGETAYHYDAVGSGANYAKGALAVLGVDLSPSMRIMQALEAAEKHCGPVRRPFHVVMTEFA